MKKVDLSKFDNSWYEVGSIIRRVLWYISNFIFFKTLIPYPYKLKVFILRFFGAKVGKNVVIKPDVNIKFPWFLEIGDNVWIGENAWIDNLTWVKIGNNVCISQGAYICTGNHNYKRESFDLIVKPVIIEDGVWIGAKSVVCPGITIASHSILVAGGVLTKNTQPYSIYKGNPAEFIRKREIS